MLFAYSYAEIEHWNTDINNGESVESYDTYPSADYVAYYGASGQVYYYRSHSSTPGGIAVGENDAVAYSNGYADSANMEMGSSSTGISNAYGMSDAGIISRTQNRFTVFPSQDSGISSGDLVTLDFTYRVDGLLSASLYQNDGNYSPWLSMDYGLTMRDPSIQAGEWSPNLLELSGDAYYSGSYESAQLRASWEEQSFNHDSQDMYDLGSWSDEQYFYNSNSFNYNYDTQSRKLQFEAIVGNPIYVEGNLWARIINNYSTTYSKVDFLDTFGMNLAATQGTYIDWKNPPTQQVVTPVPEPTTWLLLGIGILAIGVGQRKLFLNKLIS